MSDKIDSFAFRQTRQLPESNVMGGQAGAVGNWRGENLKVAQPDVAQLLFNAKEEMTFAHSERMEQKSMRERKVLAPNEAIVERITEIQEIQEWIDQLPDIDREKLKEFLTEERDGNGKSDDLLRRAQERFEDPSHAFAALDVVAKALKADNPGVAAAAAAAQAALLETDGPTVRAGINISGTAFAAAHQDKQAAHDLRELYREVVLGGQSPASIYRTIIQRLGVDDFAERLQFLSRAIGDDLAAAGPSIPPVQLREILAGLSGLRILDTAHDRCTLLAQRIGRLSGTTPGTMDVMRSLLPLTEQTTFGPGTVDGISGQLGIPDTRLDVRILLMNETRAVMALLPTGVYRDQDTRFAVLRGLQEAMDRLIEREEAQ